jgi:putative DNA primase/helicase
MRQQTLVTPNVLAAAFDYRHTCPRFMAYLDFVADGREHIIPFLQRWGAYNLVGEIFDQYLLFILGVPGSGKSTFADILARLIHTHGKAVSKGFFMRQLEKRTFELYQTRGKRGLFADETPKGATWDEILINSMLGGTMLSAEGKGRDFVDFRNIASLTVTGNHRPTFVTHSEESGIDRRLLLLEMNKKIADHMPDNTAPDTNDREPAVDRSQHQPMPRIGDVPPVRGEPFDDKAGERRRFEHVPDHRDEVDLGSGSPVPSSSQ